MPTRLARDRRPGVAGRNDKTSIDLLEHVREGVQVESRAEIRFLHESNFDSRKGSTRERAAETMSSERTSGAAPATGVRAAKSAVPE